MLVQPVQLFYGYCLVCIFCSSFSQPVYVFELLQTAYIQILVFLPSLTICFWIGLFNTFVLSLRIYIVGYMSAICYLFSVCLMCFFFPSIFFFIAFFCVKYFLVYHLSSSVNCVCLCVCVLSISVSFTYHNLFYINAYLIPVKYRNFAPAQFHISLLFMGMYPEIQTGYML